MGNSTLRDAINEIVQSQYDNKSIIFFCRVLSIDTINQTFTAQNIKGDSDDIFENCQINVGSGNNIVSMPAIDSQVLLLRDNVDNQYYMLKQDEISTATVTVTGAVKLDSTVSIESKTPEFSIDCENFYIRNNSFYGSPTADIVFNNGTNGGIPNVDYLFNRLAKLEEVLQNYKNMFAGWTPLAGDGGLALKTLFTGMGGVVMFDPGSTSKPNLEDERVLH